MSRITTSLALLICCACVAEEETHQFLIETSPGALTAEIDELKAEFEVTELRQLESANSRIWAVSANRQDEFIAQVRSARDNTITMIPLTGNYTSLFSSSIADSELAPDQADILRAVRNEASSKDVTVVQLAPLPIVTFALNSGFGSTDGFDVDGSMNLTVAEGTSATIVRDSIDHTDYGSVWRGHVVKLNNEPVDESSEVLLISDGGDVSGSISAFGKLYSIRPLGDGAHAVYEKDTRGIRPDHPEEEDSPESDQIDDEGIETENFDIRIKAEPGAESAAQPYFLDVVIAYTKNAAENYKDIETTVIRQAMIQANDALKNNGISQFSFRLACSYKTDYSEDGWENDFKRFRAANDSYMDEIHKYRDKYGGDVAILIFDDGTYCGQAKTYALNESAFGVVYHDCAGARDYSLAHELAHFVGARHDYRTDSNNEPFKHGHGYHRGTAWRTIMAYPKPCNYCVREKFWSDPDKTVDSQKAGSEELENVSKVLRDGASRVASFKASAQIAAKPQRCVLAD